MAAIHAGGAAGHGAPDAVLHHVSGDGTGREVLRAMLAAAPATPSIRLWEGAAARHLLRDGQGRIAGLVIETPPACRPCAPRAS